MKSSEAALLKVARVLPQGSTILDIGAGEGLHANWFKDKGYDVKTTDIAEGHDYVGDFNRIWYKGIHEVHGKFDCVWASHVLEHQKSTGMFITSMLILVKPGGIIAVTVPPLKNNLVGGHLNLFTPLSLVYNMILAGLDCSGASVKRYGYNISIVTRNIQLPKFPDLKYDRGDIELLAKYFPVEVKQGTEGFSLEEVNW